MQRPLLFLDLDDVLCFVSGPEAFQTPAGPWHATAVEALHAILATHHPRVVLTTGWLRLLTRRQFEALFRSTGLSELANALHEQHWDAPAIAGKSRLIAIEKWLVAHHRGEPLVVLDDEMSGTELRDSWLDRGGRVVWCELGVGLHKGHLTAVADALRSGVTLPGR